MDLINELQNLTKQLSNSLKHLRANGIKLAEAEKEYKIAVNKKALLLRSEDMPVTLINQVIYGYPDIAQLRFLRDSADVVIKNQFEENEKLKELCNKYEEEHNTTFEEWKKTKVKLSKEQRKKILKSLEEGVMEIEYFGELYDWKNAEELYKVCIKQQKEIERLTKQNKALNEMYELTKKEYIRLNNIINSFLAYLKGNEEHWKGTSYNWDSLIYGELAQRLEMKIEMSLEESDKE